LGGAGWNLCSTKVWVQWKIWFYPLVSQPYSNLNFQTLVEKVNQGTPTLMPYLKPARLIYLLPITFLISHIFVIFEF
jgi:hypothetical protein